MRRVTSPGVTRWNIDWKKGNGCGDSRESIEGLAGPEASETLHQNGIAVIRSALESSAVFLQSAKYLARIKQVPRRDRSTQDGLGAFQDCRC
jgi:hypothetical protein